MRRRASSACLRSAFPALYRGRDPQGRVLTDRQIALMAPLWLDADVPGRPRALPFLVLAAPFVIFVIAIGAVAYSWQETDAFRTVGTLNLRIFAALYALGLIAFVAGAMDMRRALRDARVSAQQGAGAGKALPIPAE
jgi:hypothetical protein